MQEVSKKKFIVVLGMHRSGTSAITRSLKVLGVDLGDTLVPPVAGDNDKGFWEDADTLSINQDIMLALGVSWCPLAPYDWSKIAADQMHKFRRQAVELLEGKLRNVDAFGIKDPRLTRLLPFWRPVFDQLDVDVRYVLVVRNPHSVAESLKRRNGFIEFRSHLLWLRHVVPSFLETCGLPRIVVGYERMMDDPKSQLRRLADNLGMPFDEHSESFVDYVRNFLSSELQHSCHTTNDLDPASTGSGVLLKQVYEALDDLANDRMQDGSLPTRELFLHVDRYLTSMEDSLAYIDQLEERSNQLLHTVPPEALRRLTELKAAYDTISQGHAWLEAQRDAWEKSAKELEHRIDELSDAVEEYRRGNAWLESQRQAWEQRAKEFEARALELERQMSVKR